MVKHAERSEARGGEGPRVSYGVRVYRGAGTWEWVGTFAKLGAAHGDPATEGRAAEHRALADRPARAA